MEICLVLAFLMWASRHLPSAECFRQLVIVVVNHLFILHQPSLPSFVPIWDDEIHHFITILKRNPHKILPRIHWNQLRPHQLRRKSSPKPEEILSQDRQTILQVAKVKVHRRSQSENFRRERSLEEDQNGAGCRKQLPRSETELQRMAAEDAETVDELSNEEFQRAVEDFITTQIKFNEEEKLAIVPFGKPLKYTVRGITRKLSLTRKKN